MTKKVKLTPEELKQKQAEYFKQYYAEKRAAISEARKRKYRTDPNYRKKVAMGNFVQYRQRVAVKNVNKGTDSSGYTKIYDDLGNQLFSITEAARSINKAVFTLRKYHETNIIPEPSREPSRGWRVYTQDQIAWMKHVFRRCTDITKNYTDLNCVQLQLRKVWNLPYDVNVL